MASGIVERDGKFWIEDLPLGAGNNFVTLTAVDVGTNSTVTNFTVVKSSVELAITPLPEYLLHDPFVTVYGTINGSGHKIWVNGMEVTNIIGNDWWVEGVPLNPGGTALVQARAIPLTDYGGNGSGGSGGGSASFDDLGNPSSATSTDAEAAVDKDPVVKVVLYDKQRSFLSAGRTPPSAISTKKEGIKWRKGMAGFWWQDECICNNAGDDDYYFHWFKYNWETSGMGTAKTGGDRGHRDDVCDVHEAATPNPYSAPENWPGEFSRVTGYRLHDIGGEKYDEVVARYAFTLYELHAGGKSQAFPPKRNLFVLTGGAEGVGDPFWPENAGDKKAYEIPAPGTILGSLGPLGGDGRLYRFLHDGETYDVTPTVLGNSYYTYVAPILSKHRLIHQTQCTALTDPRPERTQLGVGEYVNFYFDSEVPMAFLEEPWWLAFQGSVSASFGQGTVYTAPSNAVNVTVTADVEGTAKFKINFNVKKPTGYAKPPTHLAATVSMAPSETVAGAGMKNWVYIAPTDVSFYRIQVKEMSGMATNYVGCFTNHPRQHHANVWHNVGEDNIWTSTPVPDVAQDQFSIAQPGNWVPGGYTIHIPVYWTIGAPDRVKDIDEDNPPQPLVPSTYMTTWDQEFELDGTGKATVTKFGVTASRTLDDHYETSETANPDR